MDDDTEASLFIGDVEQPHSSFVDACRTVWGHGPAIRAKCCIVTRIHTYDAAQLESLRREDEGEI
jgi:hypothetical protein